MSGNSMTKKAGRPPMYGQRLRRITIGVTEEQYRWLQAQPQPLRLTVRKLVEDAMKADEIARDRASLARERRNKEFSDSVGSA